jgi:acyl-CoA synthetase (AMP-forming)/AMP-acid ligase II
MNPLLSLPEAAPALERLGDYLAAPDDNVEALITAEDCWSYARLRETVARVSGGMLRAGVQPGSCVAAFTNPGPDFWVSFLATVRLGAVWLGLSPRSTREELATIIEDARPSLIVVEHGLGLDAFPPGVSLARLADLAGSPLAQDLSDPSQPALIVFTSGSTGRRKGALISQRALIEGARRRVAAWDHGPFRTLVNVPINHIGGVGDLAVTTLVSGGCLSFMPRFDASGTLARIARDRLTFWYQVPAMFELVLASDSPTAHDLSSVKAVCWSGAPASASLVDRLYAFFPRKLGTDYSQTESVGAITIAPLGTTAEDLIGSPGWPDPLRQLKLSADGEVLVRAENCFSAYLGHDEATHKTLRDGWLHTGDLGEWLDNGRLALVGRSSDMFKSGGYNIYPREVEMVLEQLPGAARVAVIGVPHPLWGEVGHAWIEQASEPFDVEAARAALARKLAPYKHPKLFTVVDKLPLLPIGKIDRNSLKKIASGLA